MTVEIVCSSREGVFVMDKASLCRLSTAKFPTNTVLYFDNKN